MEPIAADHRSVTRTAFGLTDVGRRRAANEDAYLVDNELGLYVVADGMGGHSAGEVASEEAVNTLHDMVRREVEALAALDGLRPEALRSREPVPELQRTRRVLESAIQAATYMVFGLSESNPSQRGMGTTMSVLLLRGRSGMVAQVGDSRIYRVRDGSAQQITEDHTLVAWQLKKGLISEEEARHSRQKNVITRAVGSREYVQVDTHPVEARPGDRFLLCSDGLHGYLDDGEVPDLLADSPERAAERAILLANQRGGRDNITAVIVRVD